MNKIAKSVITLVLVLCTVMGMVAPAAAASYQTAKVSTVSVSTQSSYYMVTKSSAYVTKKASLFSAVYCKLSKNSLVWVCGSQGKYYKVNINGYIGYIRKDAVKKAPSKYTGDIYYTTKKAPLRPTPYEGKTTATLSKGSAIIVVGTVTNSKGSTWKAVSYKGGIYYIYSKNVTRAKNVTLKVSGSSHTVDTRGTLQLKATVSPAAIKNVTWSSSNPKVATVNKSGLVTGIYAGNAVITASINGVVSASWKVTVTTNIKLNVKACRQTKDYTCSAAASLAVLRYYGKETQTKDTTLYKSTDGYVYKIANVLNSRLGGIYKYSTFNSLSAYEKAIYNSLAQGSPVIARVKFAKGYFNYKSNGHYTTIVGLSKDSSGETWAKLVDSFADRYKSNTYTNAKTGEVSVPLKDLYKYGTYGGSSAIYLIYNP